MAQETLLFVSLVMLCSNDMEPTLVVRSFFNVDAATTVVRFIFKAFVVLAAESKDI